MRFKANPFVEKKTNRKENPPGTKQKTGQAEASILLYKQSGNKLKIFHLNLRRQFPLYIWSHELSFS